MNNYPFLVHSQESLSQQTAPNVDNQRLVRQKRRRTRYVRGGNSPCSSILTDDSPEDQAILEAEFEQNSKPDKATRMEIVKKVALGEKEVQVSLSRVFVEPRVDQHSCFLPSLDR